ncbi:MAG: ABC transporter permease subunit [Armatimonadota bacterium]|nr:ABC transporter permease subunit [Armatimonadota bacterium]
MRHALVAFATLAVLYGAVAQISSPYLPRRVWMGAHYIENVEFLPTYGSLATETVFLLRSGTLMGGVLVSGGRVLAGVLAGTTVGLVVGLAAAAEPRMGALLLPWVTLVRFAAALALLPLYVLWFGVGELARILLITTGVGAVVSLGVLQGASGVPRVYLEAAAVLGLPRAMTWRRVVLPCALPEIFSSVRIGVALAWTTMVVAELIDPHSPSLGYLLTLAATYPRVSTIVIGIVAIGLVVLASDRLLLAVHGRATGWMARREAHAHLA